MDYKKIMGYETKPKTKKQKKVVNNKSITESLKSEFGELKEGPAYDYAKVFKGIEKGENMQAKAVNNFVKILKKKGFPKEATNVAYAYMTSMRKFHDYLDELKGKLL